MINQLNDTRSAKRRSASKKLRTLGEPSAADALFAALRKEIDDSRTWETQYQMVMALAASSPSQLAVSFLQKLPSLDLEPMVHLAASDAIVRTSKDVDSAVLSILRSGDLMQVDGAIRALAMTRTVPSNSTIQAIIVFASEPGRSQIRFWVAAASPAWPKAIVGHFLKQCLIDDGVDIRRAAKAAIERRYLEWAPL